MTQDFPEKFTSSMQNRLGNEWTDFVNAHREPPPVSIRLNPVKTMPTLSQKSLIPWSDYGIYLNERPSFTLDPLFHAGAYYVQEPSSMFLEQAVKQYLAKPRMKVLDLCAAPGGKSTHLLSLLHPDSLLVSNEVIRSRVNILSENIQKWGYPNVVVTNNDPGDFSSLLGFFDAIVIDAPCSGEGLFRKDPQAINEWSEENVRICSERQQRIVENIWPALKENGILIYSTCTYNEFEDENTLQWINENYNVEFLPLNTCEQSIDKIVSNNTIGYRFYPHRVKGEGFFISAMRKAEYQNEVVVRRAKNGFTTPDKKNREIVQSWITTAEQKFIQRDDLIQLLPAAFVDTVHFLSKNLRMNYAGTFVASVKHNKLVPEHALAISTIVNKNAFSTVELELKDALLYLRRDPLTLQTTEKGHALATFQSAPIGWMNLLPGRINNLYPQEWRIRMQVQ